MIEYATRKTKTKPTTSSRVDKLPRALEPFDDLRIVQ